MAKGEPELLASCYRRALELAAANLLESIAFPSISTGIYGYPIEQAARIAVEVDDIEASLAKLKAQGMRLIDESPRIGAEGCLVAFVHPSAANGVLLELVQTVKPE